MKKPDPERAWALVAAEDEDTGLWWTHIVPVVKVHGFATEQEAWDFLGRMEAIGNPVLTDDDDNVTETYIGHTLKESCSCSPRKGGHDGCLLTHNQLQ